MASSLGETRAFLPRMFARDCHRGQGLAEYIIMVVVVAVVVILAIRYFGGSIEGQIQDAATQIDAPDAYIPDSTSKKKDEPKDEGSGETFSEGSRDTASPTDADSGKPSATLKAPGIGEDESAVVEDIEVSWSTIIFIAVAVLGGGTYLVFRFALKEKKKKKKEEKKKKKARKGLFKGESGQAMTEFVLSIITFLFVILGVIQLAMVLNAYTMVRYAAYNAARAAIVHGGDEDKMHEAARLSLLAIFPQHGRADHMQGAVENYVAAVATDRLPNLTFFDEPITEVRIVDADTYSNVVTFDDPQQARDGVVTVQVVHRYELVIPLVRRILFWVYRQWRVGGGYNNESINYISAESDKLRRGGAFTDIEYRIPIVAHYTMRMQSDLEI